MRLADRDVEKSKKRVCRRCGSGDGWWKRGNEEDYGSQLRRRRRLRTMAIGNGGDGGGPILVQTRSGVEYSFALHMDQA